MIRRCVVGSAGAFALVLVWGAAGVAQEVTTFGSGPDRVCNTLLDKANRPVLQKGAAASVLTAQTYDCPEAELQPIAQIEPAAPAPLQALPASGVIYFELDRAHLNAEGAATLEAMIDDIKGRQLGGITVAGHTDTSGAADYNMRLSQRRANAVATELIRAGVPAQLISADGYGQTDLAVPTADGVVNAANRRVVVDFAP
jgi:outer membrane protein OmpA-like peptidoglycan-associated protein